MFYYSKLRRFLSNSDLFFNQKASIAEGFNCIEKAEVLVDEHADIIKKIDAIIGLSAKTFRDYHLSVISNFARLVQRMPAHNSSQFLIQKTLNQYVQLLKHTKNPSRSSVNLAEHTWSFALLIALLCDVAHQAFNRYDAYYKDRNGHSISWHPRAGFFDLCHQYRHLLKDPDKQDYVNGLNRILFFNLLLTKNSHAWIAQDSLVATQMNRFLTGNNCDNSFDSLIAQLHSPKNLGAQLGYISTVDNEAHQVHGKVLDDTTVVSTSEKITHFPATIAQNDPPRIQMPKQEHLFIRTSLRHEIIIEEYKRWLNTALDEGTIRINQPNGRLHIVKEGLLLVSPGIFHDYEKVSTVPWNKLQGAILKSGWHIRDSKKHNFLTYSLSGFMKKSILKGIVIKDPTHLLAGQIPCSNTKIFLLK